MQNKPKYTKGKAFGQGTRVPPKVLDTVNQGQASCLGTRVQPAVLEEASQDQTLGSWEQLADSKILIALAKKEEEEVVDEGADQDRKKALFKAALDILEVKGTAENSNGAGIGAPDLCPLESRYLSTQNGWTRVTGVADSGAYHHVCPTGSVAGYPVRPSEMSKRGLKYTAANKGEIANEGEQLIPTYSEDGSCYAVRRLQMADVAKPLFSIAEECDQRRVVLFGATGGAILHLDTEELEWFPRVPGGGYEMTVWVPPAPGSPEALEAGFQYGMERA